MLTDARPSLDLSSLSLHPLDAPVDVPPRAPLLTLGFRHWLDWLIITQQVLLFAIPGLLFSLPVYSGTTLLINFCRWLIRDAYAPGTVLTYAGHILAAQAALIGPSLVAQSPIWSRFRASLASAASHTVNAKLGVTLAHLRLAATVAASDFDLLVALDASIVAFSALLRCKEYTADTRRRARQWQFRWRHVLGYDSAGCRVGLLHPTLARIDIHVWRKGDRGKFGHVIPLYRSGHPLLCPVAALLRRYRAAGRRPAAHAPVFTLQAGTFLTRSDVASLLKRAALAGDLDARHYSTHSLRRGGAQRLRDLGFSEPFIMIYGGWRSLAVRRYANPPPAECLTVCTSLLSGA